MKILILILTGLMIVVGVYVMTSTFDLPACAANLNITETHDTFIKGSLKDSTWPGYDGMTISMHDLNGKSFPSSRTGTQLAAPACPSHW